MAKFEKRLPEWNAPGTEPPESKRNQGWQEGDKPPAQWHNRFQHTTYEALKELREYLEQLKLSWPEIQEKPSVFPPEHHASSHSSGGDDEIKPSDIDAETPSGAQSKAGPAESNANQYTDQQIKEIPDMTWENLPGKPSEYTPESHASTHASDGSDPVSPSDIGAEPSFNKNDAFNKDFGTEKGTVAEGSHAGDKDNPHGTNAEQIGLGKVKNQEQLGKNEQASDSSKLDGKNISEVRGGVSKDDVGLPKVENIEQASKQDFDAHKADDMQHNRFEIDGIKYQGGWKVNSNKDGLTFVYESLN
ncbi:hypothetical protein GCM10028778_07970 [Barrientosiimonas marina]|uniref:Uncharacterized protein n=1 Tax=Lentibacillus kimchii TaxID=1542911 RepID=A0ABW2UXN0_9BACI